MEIIGMINNEYPNVFGKMMLMMILILMNVISCNRTIIVSFLSIVSFFSHYMPITFPIVFNSSPVLLS
jgi:hypothetical protein